MGTEGLSSREHTPTSGPQIPSPSRVARACQNLGGGSDAWGIDGPRAGGGGGIGGGGVGKGGSVSPPSIVPPLHLQMLEAAANKIWLQEEEGLGGGYAAAGVGVGGGRFVRRDEAGEQERLQKDAKCEMESKAHLGRPRGIEGGQEQEAAGVGGERMLAVEDIRARARQRLQQRRRLFDVCICTHSRKRSRTHTRTPFPVSHIPTPTFGVCALGVNLVDVYSYVYFL